MDVILIDGGLGTELQSMGYITENDKLWSGKWLIEKSSVVKRAHLNFIENGSQIIETSSYQLSVENLCRLNGYSVEEARETIKDSFRVADEARQESKQENVLIAGSIGPYGATLCDGSEFNGSYAESMSEEEFIEWHKPRMECLLEMNCDLLAIETIPSIKEAQAIVKLLARFPNAKAWLSFSCKDDVHLCNGDSFRIAYDSFKSNGQLVAIGVNCTSPFHVTGLLRSVADAEERPLERPFIVYPNDGRVWDGQLHKFIGDGPLMDPICNNLASWIELGAKYVGGCCNVGSKDINKMKITLSTN